MCLVCRDWDRERLTTKEALRALSELINLDENEDTTAHYVSIFNEIVDQEINVQTTDLEMEKAWHEETYES